MRGRQKKHNDSSFRDEIPYDSSMKSWSVLISVRCSPRQVWADETFLLPYDGGTNIHFKQFQNYSFQGQLSIMWDCSKGSMVFFFKMCVVERWGWFTRFVRPGDADASVARPTSDNFCSYLCILGVWSKARKKRSFSLFFKEWIISMYPPICLRGHKQG